MRFLGTRSYLFLQNPRPIRANERKNMKMELSPEAYAALKRDLMDVIWLNLNYPEIKARAQRIERRIAELEPKRNGEPVSPSRESNPGR